MTSALTQAKQLAAYNNSLSMTAAKQQQSFNALEAQKNRDWQERLANSAHQREIEDLKKAGLNPVLSVTGGNGATTPSGSSAQGAKADVDMSLPGLVMDWATAQLNSATTLQKTAMENTTALERTMLEQRYQNYRHITPSGSSYLGQIANLPALFAKSVGDVIGYGDKINDVLFGGKSIQAWARDKFNSVVSGKKVSEHKYTTDIDKMISGLKQGKTGKELSDYSRVENKSYPYWNKHSNTRYSAQKRIIKNKK